MINNFFRYRFFKDTSLTSRLWRSYMFIIVIVVTAITAGASYLIADYFFKTRAAELAYKGQEIADTVEYFVDNDPSRRTLIRYLIAVDRLVGARVWLFDADYNLIAASNVDSDLDILRDNTGNHNSQPNIVKIPPANQPIRSPKTNLLDQELKQGPVAPQVHEILSNIYAGKTVNSQIFHPYFKEQVILSGLPYGPSETPKGAILLAEPLSGFNTFMQNVYVYFIIVGAIGLLISLLLVWRQTKSIVRPLVEMKDTTKAIAGGNYSVQVHVEDAEEEVKDLGNSINSLSKSLSSYIAKMKQMDKIRNDFVANVSHELRTPITIIRGYNDIISDNIQGDKTNERYCALIGSETERLERLVNGLLNISRLQAADVLTKSNTEPLPMADIIRLVAEKLRLKAETKHITQFLHLEEQTQVIGDGDQMVQLVLLFGDNAIKYSPEGSNVKYETGTQPDGSFVLTVSDNGPGIPAADLPFIFERFYKVDKSHSKSITKGTGLGLAIAKEIIRMHGATVRVQSKLGQGSSFIITFPADKVVHPDLGQ